VCVCLCVCLCVCARARECTGIRQCVHLILVHLQQLQQHQAEGYMSIGFRFRLIANANLLPASAVPFPSKTK